MLAMWFRSSLLTVLLLALASGAALANARDEAKAQVAFGIRVAQAGLWREALYRFTRAVAIDPTYAAGYNNLAIAYEQTGQPDKAREAYERALALDPGNSLIVQNYELFKEIHDRTRRPPDR